MNSEGFFLPELIIESIIRDGIQNVKSNTAIIPDIFQQLKRGYNNQKYGTTEITKIQTLINTTPLPVVYSYTDVDAKSPCFSIMVGTDDEQAKLDKLNDYLGEETDDITDPVQLAALIVVPNFTPLSYDPNSGLISVDDSIDLTPVYKGFIFVDALNTEHEITGIVTASGQKALFVPKFDEINISGNCFVKSPLNYTQTEIRGISMDTKMVIGVHAKDALTVKYLYILLKYWIASRKTDIISRGLYLAMLSGSDFNRNQEYLGDRVFTRFLTVSGKVDDSWKQDQVQLFDSIIIDATPIDD